MAERSLDHFFNVVCHESRWWPNVHVDDRHDLLRKAIIHLVTASPALPRLRRAAQAWMPITHTHRQFRRLMLAKDLQPLTRDQLTEPAVRVLMQNLEGWLRTNWYRKGEVMFNEQLAARDPTHATWSNAAKLATKERPHG